MEDKPIQKNVHYIVNRFADFINNIGVNIERNRDKPPEQYVTTLNKEEPDFESVDHIKHATTSNQTKSNDENIKNSKINRDNKMFSPVLRKYLCGKAISINRDSIDSEKSPITDNLLIAQKLSYKYRWLA